MRGVEKGGRRRGGARDLETSECREECSAEKGSRVRVREEGGGEVERKQLVFLHFGNITFHSQSPTQREENIGSEHMKGI